MRLRLCLITALVFAASTLNASCAACRTGCGNQPKTMTTGACCTTQNGATGSAFSSGPNPFCHPWWFRGEFIETGTASFCDPEESHERFRFLQWYTDLSYLEKVSCHTGIAAGASYRGTRMSWENSPYLTHPDFEEVGVFLQGFTRRLNCWLWRGGVRWWQQLYNLNMGRYGELQTFAWGRYEYWRNCLGLHVGIWVEAGKRAGFVRPILGIDYRMKNGLIFNLVYPVDISILYCLTPTLKVGLGGRPNRTRMRMRPTDPVPEGIIEYRMWGTDARLVWEPIPGAKLEIFGGSTVWSFVRVRTQLNKHIAYRNVEPIYFVGLYAFAAY